MPYTKPRLTIGEWTSAGDEIAVDAHTREPARELTQAYGEHITWHQVIAVDDHDSDSFPGYERDGRPVAFDDHEHLVIRIPAAENGASR